MVVEDNWEKVLDYFDIPTLIIGGLVIGAAVVWYLRRRKQQKRVEELASTDGK